MSPIYWDSTKMAFPTGLPRESWNPCKKMQKSNKTKYKPAMLFPGFARSFPLYLSKSQRNHSKSLEYHQVINAIQIDEKGLALFFIDFYDDVKNKP